MGVIETVGVVEAVRRAAGTPPDGEGRLIPVAEPVLGERELANVVEAVRSGWVSSKGPFVEAFEAAIAARCGAAHGVAVSSGTAGLHLALAALGIGRGDEVIVPSFSFVATASTVRHVGATPVCADAESDHWCIDPAEVARLITARTRAIVPVHQFGHPANMDAILDLAHHHDLFVVEDAAEALGASYRGRPAGGLGDVGVFSFYANKVITTGEGGMLVTNDVALADRMRMLRDHGMDPQRRYWHPEVGFNFRLTNLQAALGMAQVERLPALLERKAAIGHRYTAALQAVPGIILQCPSVGGTSSWWMFTILLDEAFGLDPASVGAALLRQGVDTRPGLYPIHTMPPYASGRRCPVAERLGQRTLSLPSGASLNDADQSYVIDRLRALAGSGRK
jgi:perosamine synthetase